MKSIFGILAIAATTQLIMLPPVHAQEESSPPTGQPSTTVTKVDEARVQDGKLIAVVDGKSFTPTNTLSMPFNIKVMTNLTFTVNDGAPRKLADGQILAKDGTLQSPDGSLMPVLDHVTQKDGKVVIYKDGVARPLAGEDTLGDGTKVMADGTYIDNSGHPRKLVDGQQIKLDGSTLPATDTATLKSGKVVIQKDGSLITLRPAQTMMMSDGTKVVGDGTVIDPDGKTSTLTEGQIVRIEGVRRK